MKDKNTIEQDVPQYLKKQYWWAYLHPRSVSLFERQWLVNLILFGNYRKLRNALIEEVNAFPGSRSLQIACAYGDFSLALLDKLGGESRLDVVDVAQIQLDNLREKLKLSEKLKTIPENIFVDKQDSTCLSFEDSSFDNVVLFFLLHEQPREVREKTVREAQRVCKPGGRIIYVDYHKPHRLNPLRFLLNVILRFLEPYALDFQESSIESLHDEALTDVESKQVFFGGFYQRLTFRKK